jgi:hypothetical protein
MLTSAMLMILKYHQEGKEVHNCGQQGQEALILPRDSEETVRKEYAFLTQ